jgi:hypothetical protein
VQLLKERKMTDRFIGKGSMTFPDGEKNPVNYDISIWREFWEHQPLSSEIKGRLWSVSDPYLSRRYLGKQFILEMEEGRRVALFISDSRTGNVEHCPGPVEGFPGLKG